MARRRLPLSDVYGLLEPGPVVLLATSAGGRPNLMTHSWHTMLDFEPPLVGVVVSSRNHSFEALRKTRECVIAIPTVELADAVVGCGNSSGRDTDKFAAFGLTAKPASEVSAPLVNECFANLECRVADTRMVKRYELFVLEVVAAWIDPRRKKHPTMHHRGWGEFMLAGETVKTSSRMR